MRLFWRLCHISFWIVLAVFAFGVFESYGTPFMGCRPGDLGLECAEGPLKEVKEVLVNLPVLFLIALLMPLEGPAWAVLLKLLLGLIAVLALVHVGRFSSAAQQCREGAMTPSRRETVMTMLADYRRRG
jgi:hypothetical protein